MVLAQSASPVYTPVLFKWKWIRCFKNYDHKNLCSALEKVPFSTLLKCLMNQQIKWKFILTLFTNVINDIIPTKRVKDRNKPSAYINDHWLHAIMIRNSNLNKVKCITDNRGRRVRDKLSSDWDWEMAKYCPQKTI